MMVEDRMNSIRELVENLLSTDAGSIMVCPITS